jgi:hypothetical protein
VTYNRSFRPTSSSSSSIKNQLILSVGRHAYLALPPSGAADGDFTPFGQEKKTAPAKDLCDGQEVEIIAWRPTAAGGVAYQIQRVSDRREWWARGTCLRTSAEAPAVLEAK